MFEIEYPSTEPRQLALNAVVVLDPALSLQYARGYPHVWLTYRNGKNVEVYIVQARLLMEARMRAQMHGQEGDFVGGHALEEFAQLVDRI